MKLWELFDSAKYGDDGDDDDGDEDRENFTSLEKWKEEVKARDWKVKKGTTGKWNTHYKAIKDRRTIVGYFNDWKPGNPESKSAGGSLSNEH
jgi:hypothetical protein